MGSVLRGRRPLLAASGVALAVGLADCGGSRHATPPPPQPKPATTHVIVSVVDGDTGGAIAHARVSVGHLVVRSNPRGMAPLRVRGRVRLLQVSASGYDGRTLRTPSQTRLVVRLYRPATQWPLYGVVPERTQAQTAIQVRPPFRTVWSRNLYALLEFPAVVADGAAYVWNGSGFLFALSMADGSTLWKYAAGVKRQASSPAVAGALVVAHVKDGRVLVFDRTTGQLLWQRNDGSPVESSPVVVGGVDYYGDWGGNVSALDLQTHRLRWQYHGGCKITASVAVSHGTLYVGDYCGRLLALSTATGKLRFSASAGSPVYGSSAVANGRVFTPSRDSGAVIAFTTSGRGLWSVSTGAYVYSAPAVWGDRVYFGSYNGTLYCVSASSGSVLWRTYVGGAISGSPTVVDGIVYAGSFANHIVGLDARSGRVVFRFPHGHYVAVAGNGGRLLLHGWGGLWAVEPRR